MDYDVKTTGSRIRACREARGLSQAQLAIRLGYHGRSAISKIENGERNIPLEQIRKLAAVLNTTPEYLLGWNDEYTVPDATLPENPTLTGMKAEIVELVATMPEDKQKLLLELIKSMKNGR